MTYDKARPGSLVDYQNKLEGADIIITVEGGVVQSVHSIFSLLPIYVADLDNEEVACTPQEFEDLVNRIKTVTKNMNLVY